MGTNAVIGVKPADEYQFRILVTPVGPYFKGGAKQSQSVYQTLIEQHLTEQDISRQDSTMQ